MTFTVSRRKLKITSRIAQTRIIRHPIRKRRKSAIKAKESQQRRRRQNYCPHLDKLRPKKLMERPQVPLKSTNNKAPPVECSLAGKTSSFDHWIDELTEFEETKIAPKVGGAQVSIEDALIKLEANRDIPNVVLSKFSGDPLGYADFIDRFKIHIHDKPHLTDDVRMIQLKMHTTDDAERAISGLGSKGTMYATALKTIKNNLDSRV